MTDHCETFPRRFPSGVHYPPSPPTTIRLAAFGSLHRHRDMNRFPCQTRFASSSVPTQSTSTKDRNRSISQRSSTGGGGGCFGFRLLVQSTHCLAQRNTYLVGKPEINLAFKHQDKQAGTRPHTLLVHTHLSRSMGRPNKIFSRSVPD